MQTNPELQMKLSYWEMVAVGWRILWQGIGGFVLMLFLGNLFRESGHRQSHVVEGVASDEPTEVSTERLREAVVPVGTGGLNHVVIEEVSLLPDRNP